MNENENKNVQIAEEESQANSKNTSSKEESPLTSSMVPEATRLPPLIMATL